MVASTPHKEPDPHKEPETNVVAPRPEDRVIPVGEEQLQRSEENERKASEQAVKHDENHKASKK